MSKIIEITTNPEIASIYGQYINIAEIQLFLGSQIVPRAQTVVKLSSEYWDKPRSMRPESCVDGDITTYCHTASGDMSPKVTVTLLPSPSDSISSHSGSAIENDSSRSSYPDLRPSSQRSLDPQSFVDGSGFNETRTIDRYLSKDHGRVKSHKIYDLRNVTPSSSSGGNYIYRSDDGHTSYLSKEREVSLSSYNNLNLDSVARTKRHLRHRNDNINEESQPQVHGKRQLYVDIDYDTLKVFNRVDDRCIHHSGDVCRNRIRKALIKTINTQKFPDKVFDIYEFTSLSLLQTQLNDDSYVQYFPFHHGLLPRQQGVIEIIGEIQNTALNIAEVVLYSKGVKLSPELLRFDGDILNKNQCNDGNITTYCAIHIDSIHPDHAPRILIYTDHYEFDTIRIYNRVDSCTTSIIKCKETLKNAIIRISSAITVPDIVQDVYTFPARTRSNETYMSHMNHQSISNISLTTYQIPQYQNSSFAPLLPQVQEFVASFHWCVDRFVRVRYDGGSIWFTGSDHIRDITGTVIQNDANQYQSTKQGCRGHVYEGWYHLDVHIDPAQFDHVKVSYTIYNDGQNHPEIIHPAQDCMSSCSFTTSTNISYSHTCALCENGAFTNTASTPLINVVIKGYARPGAVASLSKLNGYPRSINEFHDGLYRVHDNSFTNLFNLIWFLIIIVLIFSVTICKKFWKRLFFRERLKIGVTSAKDDSARGVITGQYQVKISNLNWLGQRKKGDEGTLQVKHSTISSYFW